MYIFPYVYKCVYARKEKSRYANWDVGFLSLAIHRVLRSSPITFLPFLCLLSFRPTLRIHWRPYIHLYVCADNNKSRIIFVVVIIIMQRQSIRSIIKRIRERTLFRSFPSCFAAASCSADLSNCESLRFFGYLFTHIYARGPFFFCRANKKWKTYRYLHVVGTFGPKN